MAPIEQRGWCIFECCLSCVRKSAHCCLALSPLSQADDLVCPRYWGDVVRACQVGRLPPQTPDAFEATLCEGMANGEVRFTNGKDATAVCIPQYREGFMRLMRIGGMLNFYNCGWADAEAQLLFAAIQWAHGAGATTQAETLLLGSNKLTDAVVPLLVEVVEAGALPQLLELNLEDNELGDAALGALQPLLKGSLSHLGALGLGTRLTAEGARSLCTLLSDGHLAQLEEFDLRGNHALGDAGAIAIATALSNQCLPKLVLLRLESTGIGEAGASSLADALRGAPAVKMLVIGENPFGTAMRAKIKAACDERDITAFSTFGKLLVV